MKKKAIYLAMAVLAACSCAKSPVIGLNDADKAYLAAWVQLNHPNATKTALGSYILEDTPGTGALVSDSDTNPFVRLEYEIRGLDGSVQQTYSKEMAQRLGTYSVESYYGPMTQPRGEGYTPAGLEEVISDMRVGGRRTVLIPGWLLSTRQYYKTAKDYENNVSGTTAIYDITVKDAISDINKWETDSVGRYILKTFPGMTPRDSVKYGFYYKRTGQPSSLREFPADTIIYINYVGRLLNGQVFDTSIRDTAAYYGLYSSSRSYGPVKITWYTDSGTYSDIKFGDSSGAIDGFLYALMQMHPHEKGAAVFYSGLGYSSKGTSSIPAYSPLRFDIEVVDEP